MPFTLSHLFWVEDYLEREKEFMDFISFVPPSKEHDEVWSLKLANQLLLIGSSIDSFFKVVLKEHVLLSLQLYQENCCFINDKTKFIKDMKVWLERLSLSEKKKRGSRRHKFVSMNDYRDIFESKYVLSQHPVFFLMTKDKIYPFEFWAKNKSPSWWNVYTNLKHSRVKNRKSATIEQVLSALSALFLLNVYFPLNREYLALNEVITYGADQGKNWLVTELNNDHINTNPGLFVPIAKTRLFAYLFDDNHIWHKRENAWLEIEPYGLYSQK